MPRCKHKNLVLISENKEKLRCRDCHLTISREELADGYCPECYEERGVKNKNFERVEMKEGSKVRYRCEGCGIFIECP